jgi:hypothetical protein
VLVGSDRVPGTVTGFFLNLADDEETRFEATRGRFEVELEPGTYWVVDVEVDGEEIKHFHQEVAVERGGEVEVRIPEAFEVTLVVIDARDRTPIAGALVYENRDGEWHFEWERGNRLPGPLTLRQQPRRTDALGRLPLGRGRGSAELCVHAEGRAWNAVEVPFGAGAEVVVELVAGGDVRLLIPRLGELLAPRISAKSESHSFPLVPADGAEEILVHGLAEDEYEFTVRRGESYELGKVYGTAKGWVRAGETTTITVPVTPDPAPVMVKVTGTIKVPGGWKEPLRYLSLKGLEESNTEVERTLHEGRRPTDEGFLARGGDGFRFEFSAVPSGRYLVKFDGYQWKKELRVTDRTSQFDLELPRPVTVRVHVVDTKGQDLISTVWASFQAPFPFEAELPENVEDVLPAINASGQDQIEPEDGVLVFQAPPGDVTISANAPGFVDGELSLEIREDRDVTLTLERAGIVAVRLRIDGEPFDGASTRMSLGDDTRSWMLGFDGGVARFDRLPPGTWTARVGDVAGCEPARPVEVDVAGGETREVTIDLKRKVR